jgi:signal transduction histidine kinase
LIRSLLAEIERLRDPRTLMLGVVSGYALTVAFGVLTWIVVAAGVLPWHWAFGALLGAKLLTNTAALVALKLDRFALPLGGINVAMDAVVMTGAIWATGDTASPLVAIYTIEVTVLALLTNLATTALIGVFAIGLYIAMAVLTARGVLPQFPTPAEWSGRTATYAIIACTFTTFVIVVPTFYTAGILRRLRDNERRLEAHTAALVDAGKQKAQFMANITHELRTPLQGVIGLAQLVAKGVYGTVSERQAEAMANIHVSARRLDGLIDDLLQLASHDAGRRQLELAAVDVADVMSTASATAQWLLGGKQLRVELDLEPDLGSIQSDRAKLSQIVLNLLSNAIKFTPDGGRIVLRARRYESGIELEVEDTGVGIPADQLDRVFDEFHQVDGSSSREFGGVGLGLALVKRLTEMLRGSVAVASEVARGSTFTVRLPRAAFGAESERQRTAYR